LILNPIEHFETTYIFWLMGYLPTSDF